MNTRTHTTDEHDELDPEDLPPSKSQLKREAHALQDLGARLITVKEAEWDRLNLPEQLVAALRESKKTYSHGASKRQRQYIGKLMRELDVEPIQQYFEQLHLQSRQQAQHHHDLEEWRDRMIEQGDSVVEKFIDLHPNADRQHLRQLVRQVRKELQLEKPPKSSRALFRYIRDL